MQKLFFPLYLFSCYLFWMQTFNILLFSSVAFVAVKESFCAFCKFMLKLFLSGNWVKQYQVENLRQLFNFKQFSNVFLQNVFGRYSPFLLFSIESCYGLGELASGAWKVQAAALYCVTRAPLPYFIRSWVALSFKVVSHSVICQDHKYQPLLS